MIYFVQRSGGGPIKIGTTSAMPTRLTALRWAARSPLVVLGIRDGGTLHESRIHGMFAHLRLEGEWFVDDPSLRRYIEEECRPWNGESDVDEISDWRTMSWLPPAGQESRGQIISQNLERLGHPNKTGRCAAIARGIEAATGTAITPQRVAVILNSYIVAEDTIKAIADAVGVKPSELTRMPKGDR